MTPVDLETTVFRRGWRGYNTKEVQEFMNRMTHDYEYLYRENINLKEKIEELNIKLSQYQLMEENLRNAVILAQKTAEEVKNSAQNQATTILREAGQQSEEIKRRVKSEIQTELQNLAILKNQLEFFRCQFKSFILTLTEVADKQLDLEVVWDKIIQKLPGIHKYQESTKGAAVTDGDEPNIRSDSNDDSNTSEGITNEEQAGLKLRY